MVCDSHHAVLRHWLAAAKDGRLPPSGLTVVHFDAHPDLAVPGRVFPRSLRDQPDVLEGRLDIASFQLAAAWLGLVDRVIWLRPEWATQLPDGEQRFVLGATPEGRLRVDAVEDYWVLDESWAPRSQLRDPVELRLEVMTLAEAAADPSRLPRDTHVLDIDLDGFATRNPGADQLREAGLDDAELERLRGAFAQERLAFSADPETRIRDLASLLGALEDVNEGGVLEQLGGAFRLWRFGVSAGDLWYFYGVLGREDLVLGGDLLAQAGRDLVGLPERRADRAEIARTAQQLAALLGPEGPRPRLMSVARSANDGYTPQRAWPRIEWALLDALGERLAGASIEFDRGLEPAPRPAP